MRVMRGYKLFGSWGKGVRYNSRRTKHRNFFNSMSEGRAASIGASNFWLRDRDRFGSVVRKPRVNYGWGHWIGGKKAAIDYASKKGAGW
jgi:hypothetical protein